MNLPHDSFSYRAVVASNAAIKSLPVTQEVRVTNVNDGTTLAVPTEQEGLKVYAFSTLNPSDCGGDNAELDECQVSFDSKKKGLLKRKKTNFP